MPRFHEEHKEFLGKPRKSIFKVKTVGFAHTHKLFEKSLNKNFIFDLIMHNLTPNRTYVRFNIKVLMKLFQKFLGWVGQSPAGLEN
jgi:hypothetical protein